MKKKNEQIPFDKWIWKSFDGTSIVDIKKFILDNKECDFYIGTDSKNRPSGEKKFIITTSIIAYRPKKGGTIIVHTEKSPEIKGLRQKLLEEALRSLQTAMYVNTLCSEENSLNLCVHLDVNGSLKYDSGKYMEELVGMIVGQGFKVQYKPNAWAASNVSDKKT